MSTPEIERMQESVLGFCACGMPDENLAYVRDGLAHIAEDGPNPQGDSAAWEAWLREHRERGAQLFGNERAERFFYYWADKEELSEHGGCVPGWLTEKGLAMLADLRALQL